MEDTWHEPLEEELQHVPPLRSPGLKGLSFELQEALWIAVVLGTAMKPSSPVSFQGLEYMVHSVYPLVAMIALLLTDLLPCPEAERAPLVWDLPLPVGRNLSQGMSRHGLLS